ncbi:Dihydroorotase [compost metagenome]
MAIAPRKLLKLEVPEIKVGAVANFTVFNPTKEWTFNSDTNKSKSANSPLFNKTLKGKVELVYNNGQHIEY